MYYRHSHSRALMSQISDSGSVHLTGSPTYRIILELHPTTGTESCMCHYNQNTDCQLKKDNEVPHQTPCFICVSMPASRTRKILVSNHHNALAQSLRNLALQHANKFAGFRLNCELMLMALDSSSTCLTQRANNFLSTPPTHL